MPQVSPPLVVVVSGVSGVGKDALIARIRERTDRFVVPVTMTTRAPRPAEVHGRDYLFTTREAFIQALEANELLEHAEVYGNFYGVPRSQLRDALAAGRDVVVQPYIASVDHRGETAVICFDGVPSHAIRKGPILRGGVREVVGDLYAAEDISPRSATEAELDADSGVVALSRLSITGGVSGLDDVPVTLNPGVLKNAGAGGPTDSAAAGSGSMMEITAPAATAPSPRRNTVRRSRPASATNSSASSNDSITCSTSIGE